MASTGLGVPLSTERLVYAVLQVEQAMTTGGGWQDQIGGVYGGFKICRSPTGLPLTLAVSPCAVRHGVDRRFSQRCFLVFTGQQRLAKTVLINALRRGALTPCDEMLGEGGVRGGMPSDSTVCRLVKGAEKGFSALHHLHHFATNASPSSVSADLETADAVIDELCAVLNDYRALKAEMASGTEPPVVRNVLEQCLEPLCQGLALCGAGGGGFAVCVLRTGLVVNRASGEDEQAMGMRLLREALDSHNHREMTVHSVDVDNDGLSLRWLDDQNENQDLANVLATAAGLAQTHH
jgi:fucokinase